MKIKCTKCESVKDAGRFIEAVEAGIAVMCLNCGNAQPHERVIEDVKTVAPATEDYEELLEYLEGNFEEFDRCDSRMAHPGYEAAIEGFTTSWHGNSHPLRIIYSGIKMIEITIKRDGMSFEEAYELVESIDDAYVGEHTPIIMYTEVI